MRKLRHPATLRFFDALIVCLLVSVVVFGFFSGGCRRHRTKRCVPAVTGHVCR